MIATIPTMTTQPQVSATQTSLALPLACAHGAGEYAERAAMKMRFIRLLEQFEADDVARQVLAGTEWNQLEHALKQTVLQSEAESWRTSLSFLLRQMRERTNKNHPQYYRPFPPAEAAFLRAYHASRCPEYPTIANTKCPRGTTRLTTLLGYPLTNGITRLVVGDYGAYIEFAPEQLVAKLATKFPGTQKPWIKYVWLVHPKDERTKIYLQKKTVRYADYRPGMYYVSPEDVWAYG